MKKYLEIYVGSRGYLEGVEEKVFEDIEKELEKESKENKEFIEEGFEGDEEEEYKEEILGYWDWDENKNGYYLGLGDEEVKYYVDMDCDKFKEWLKKKEDEMGEDWNWNDLSDESIMDILDICEMYG